MAGRGRGIVRSLPAGHTGHSMRTLALALVLFVSCRQASPPAVKKSVPRKVVVEQTPPPEEPGDLTLRVLEHEDRRWVVDVQGARVTFEFTAQASLRVDDADAGARLVERAAAWLSAPVPLQTHQRPLTPLVFESRDIDPRDEAGRSWNRARARFHVGADELDVFVMTTANEQWLRLRVKDPYQARPLLDLLADTVRDGPAPPRSAATDRGFIETPRYSLSEPSAPPETSAAVCFDDGWAAQVVTSEGAWVDFIPWGGGKPRTLCTMPGTIIATAHAPRVPTAVAVVRLATADDSGLAAPVELWRVSSEGCKVLTPKQPVEFAALTQLLMSPSGTHVGYESDGFVILLRVSDGWLQALTLGSTGPLRAWGWDEQGFIARQHRKEAWVRPGGRPLSVLPLRSSDGRYALRRDDRALVVRDTATDAPPRRLELTRRADLRALERWSDGPPVLVGPHGLVLAADVPLFVDLDTLTMQPLAPTGASLRCSTADGAHAVFFSESGRFLEGAPASAAAAH